MKTTLPTHVLGIPIDPPPIANLNHNPGACFQSGFASDLEVAGAQARSEKGAYSKKYVTDKRRSISASQPKDDGECTLKSRPTNLNPNLNAPLPCPPNPTPWPNPVSGSALLTDLAATLRRFVAAPDDAITAASLFVLHTYAFDFGDLSPVLFITGSGRRCGKSRLIDLLSRLVSKPLCAASASPAAIYHSIELHRPTLCLDDVDSFVRSRDQLRALVNSGARDSAFHLAWSRGSAKTGESGFRQWSTWTPRIFSGVGKIAEAARDCAIAIGMNRPPAGERREYLRHRTRFEDLRRKALRFATDHEDALRTAKPSIPDNLGDPAADHWTPLLAIADLAGGDWPDRRAAPPSRSPKSMSPTHPMTPPACSTTSA